MTHEKTPVSKGIWLTNGLLIGEIVAIIGVLIAIQSQIQAQSQRSDDLHREFISLANTQSQRSDDLYREFINLVKEVRK